MTTLYERLTARIDECAAEIRELLKVNGVGISVVNQCTCATRGMYGLPHEPGCGIEQGPAWPLLRYGLRGLEEDRDILQRHALPDRVPIDDLPPYPCEWCSRRASDPAFTVWVDWPCEEIRSLARRHGVEVEGR